MTVEIRPTTAADFESAKRLLKKAGLPTADLQVATLRLAADCNGELRGLIGLEDYGKCALLRSLVIADEARGTGVGSLLMAALESECAAAGIDELWLLTIDADGFFAARDYAVRQRSDAPPDIRASREFSGLCPDSAILMSKTLASGS